MKKYSLHITGFILLAMVALILHKYRNGTTLNRRETDFAITDYERIDKVIISGDEEMSVLAKENGHWLINSRYEAREKAVELLLQTFGRLRVSSPAPLSVQDEIMEKLLQESVIIEIVMGRRSRTYYVYSEGDHSPTYMLRKGSSRPYSMEVLGYGGNVASLFVPDEGYWRTDILFNYRLNDIAEVLVHHRENEKGSFILRQSPDGEYSLYSYPGGELQEGISDSLAVRYLANFFYTPFERMANRDERLLIDSLLNAGYDHLIRVTGHDGSVSEALFHKIVLKGGGNNNSVKFDLFRLHALINEKSDMIVIPYHYVDLLLRSASYFYARQ